MAIHKIWRGFKKIQQKVDFTPYLLKISEKYSKKNKASMFLFLLFILIGFFGLILPLVQGWITIMLAFTFLGIKPLNSWMKNNKKAVSNIGTTLFLVAMISFVFTTSTWAIGLSEDSPLDNIFKVITFGKDDLKQMNTQAFSVLGMDYNNVQQSFSIINYNQNQGFSVIGTETTNNEETIQIDLSNKEIITNLCGELSSSDKEEIKHNCELAKGDFVCTQNEIACQNMSISCNRLLLFAGNDIVRSCENLGGQYSCPDRINLVCSI